MKKIFSFLLLGLVLSIGNAWATDYSYTFSSGVYTAAGSQTLGGVSWTMAGTGGSYFGYDNTKGQQFGSGSKPFSAVTLSTSGISGTITSVAINTSGANSIAATVGVSVNGIAFKHSGNTTVNLTSTATSYTFSGSASGDIVISWAQTSSKAIYIKSITVTYEAGGGSDPSITLNSTTIAATDAEKVGTLTVTYENIANVDAEVVFYESNGNTPTTYDWVDAEINATDNTQLDYVIGANTGAARTAYMKVHQKNSEVYSNLITISQDAKTVTPPAFSPDGGSCIQGTPITITSVGNTIYYEMTLDGSTPSAPTSSSTKYTAPIALNSGTVKIKAIAYDAYDNASTIVTRTFTAIATTDLPFSWTGTSSAGKANLSAKTGVAINLGSDYAASNAPYRLKFDDAGKHVTVYSNVKPEIVYFTAKLFNATSTGSKIKVQGSADGLSFDDVEEFIVSGAAGTTFEFTTSNDFESTHRVVRIVLSTKDQNVAVGTITITNALTLGANGYSTYAADFKYTVSGAEVYEAALNNAQDAIILTKVENAVVPANAGIILKGTEGATVTITPSNATASTFSNNQLVGVLAPTEVETNWYVLATNLDGDGLTKFHKCKAGIEIPANKAYIEIGAATAPSIRIIEAGNEATDIQNVEGAEKAVKFIENGKLYIQKNGVVYDAMGKTVR